MVSPPCSYYERDNLASETVPFIQFPDGRAGAGTGNPPAGPCNLITRIDGWEVIVPLQFIRMEDI